RWGARSALVAHHLALALAAGRMGDGVDGAGYVRQFGLSQYVGLSTLLGAADGGCAVGQPAGATAPTVDPCGCICRLAAGWYAGPLSALLLDGAEPSRWSAAESVSPHAVVAVLDHVRRVSARDGCGVVVEHT